MINYRTVASAAAVTLVLSGCSVIPGIDVKPSAYALVPELPSRDAIRRNTLIHQTASVRTSCFGDDLRMILADLSDEFGTPAIVTSGHRGSAKHGGSLHGHCKAADIQFEGVSPARVAAAARRHKLVGGIGTYCHTKSVHVDVGDRREWNWGCRNRSS